MTSSHPASIPLRPTLLDCTLRDGGNQNAWRFTDHDVATIVEVLDRAGVDVIEVGYRGGSGSGMPSDAGSPAFSSPEYLTSLPDTTRARLAVMVVPSVCPASAMDDLSDGPVDLVRIASYPWNVGGVPDYLDHAHALGLAASVNIMAASYVSPDELGRIARLLASASPDVVYIADSFGGLTPDDVRARIRALVEALECPIGIHAHNNLGLGVTNAVAALEVGATWIDASLGAMARGAGNVATEQAAAFLRAWPRFSSNVEPSLVCDASEYMAENVLPRPMVVRRAEIAAGLNNHHYYYQEHIDKIATHYGLDPWEVGDRVGGHRPHRVSDALVDEVCREMARTTDVDTKTNAETNGAR
jgi:4-hydroxy 2-oxovalerate aldolase